MVLAATSSTRSAAAARQRDDHVPRYPHELPSGVVLTCCRSPTPRSSLLKVENPDYDYHALDPGHPLVAGRPAERHLAKATELTASKPTTIGGFYAEIVDGLKQAATTLGEQALFCGDPARQVTREYYYAGGGDPIAVTNLETPPGPLAEIVDQGEGDMTSMYDNDADLAQLLPLPPAQARSWLRPGRRPDAPTGRRWRRLRAVYPMLANPAPATTPIPTSEPSPTPPTGRGVGCLSRSRLAFNGTPGALLPAVHSMFKVRDARSCCSPTRSRAPGTHAGPPSNGSPSLRCRRRTELT